MTKEEKKERRQVRHEIQAKAFRFARRRIGLWATVPQLRDAAKILASRYIAQEANAGSSK
jgi:hypothetical protein